MHAGNNNKDKHSTLVIKARVIQSAMKTNSTVHGPQHNGGNSKAAAINNNESVNK